MGKKYKKKLPIKPPKRIPTVFQCPNCGKKAVKVVFNKEKDEALVSCGNCKIQMKIHVAPIFEAVDVYGKFIDAYYNGKIKLEDTDNEDVKDRGS